MTNTYTPRHDGSQSVTEDDFLAAWTARRWVENEVFISAAHGVPVGVHAAIKCTCAAYYLNSPHHTDGCDMRDN